jgi:subtilisin family serine protease
MLKQKIKDEPIAKRAMIRTRRASIRCRGRLALAFLLVLFLGGAIPTVKAQGGESAGEEFVPGEVVVQLGSAIDLSDVARQYKLDPVPLDQFGRRPIYRLRIADNAPVAVRVSELQADSQSRVIYAEPNYLVKPPKGGGILWSDGLPGGDAGAGDYTSQWATQQIQLSIAHSVARGAGIRIAVLDTGVDFTHPALAGHLLPGYDFVDMDNNPEEVGELGQGAYGHGTHVTGLLALVAPEAKIMPLRVLNENGIGNIWVLAEALEYAINPDGNPDTDDGAHVINLSLSTPRRTNLLLNILRKVTGSCSEGGCDFQINESNTVVVAASGNNGNNIPQYPAAESFHALLAVAANDENGVITDFSTRGTWVGLLAPGAGIVSTVPGGGYASWDGTSAAAPIAAGVVALVRSAFPAENNSTVAAHVLSTAIQVPGPVQRRLDAGAALKTRPAAYVPPAIIQFSGGASIDARYYGYEFARNIQVSVSRHGSDAIPVTVDYATSDKAGGADCATTSGNASSRCDYTSLAGTLRFEPGERTKYISIPVANDTYREGNETFNLTLSNPTGASLGRTTVATIIIREDERPPSDFEFSSTNYSVTENSDSPLHSAVVTVKRTGDLRGSASVEVKTITNNTTVPCDPTARDTGGNLYPQGAASERCDYTPKVITLLFGPNESSKDVLIPIIDDAYVEAPENVMIVMTNPLGAGIVGQNLVTLTIMDNDVAGSPNPISSNEFFVRQHYLDFLDREPDAEGYAYWTTILNGCGADLDCQNKVRVEISSRFFIELEFQRTGFFVMRLYQASFGNPPNYEQFITDRKQVQNTIESQKQFAAAWVQRQDFLAAYPAAMTHQAFVKKLYDAAGVANPAARAAAEQGLIAGTKSRADVVFDLVELAEFQAREYNPAFVRMQYFGYLRRNVETEGYNYWMNVSTNIAPNNYRSMICAFVNSNEYQLRFHSTRGKFNELDCGW